MAQVRGGHVSQLEPLGDCTAGVSWGSEAASTRSLCAWCGLRRSARWYRSSSSWAGVGRPVGGRRRTALWLWRPGGRLQLGGRRRGCFARPAGA